MNLLLAVFLAVALAQTPQAGSGVIQGTVTHTTTPQPVADARVTIWGDNGPDFQTSTDANGQYAFRDVPPGTYNIETMAEGFLPVPNPSLGPRIRITVGDGQTVKHDIAMPGMAAIHGRVLNDNHEPIATVAIEVLRLSHDVRGRTTWIVAQSTVTSETGEYRVEQLPENDYYVRATQRPEVTQTYFPGTLDARVAAPIRLREGDDVNAEFPWVAGGTYSVDGTIVRPGEVGPFLLAVPQDSKIPRDNIPMAGVAVFSDHFQLSGLLPGVYDFFAIAGPSHEVDRDTYMWLAKASAEIRDEDVKDLKLVMEPGVAVSGHLQRTDGKRLQFDSKGADRLIPTDVVTENTTIHLRLGLTLKEDVVGALVLPRITKVVGDAFTFGTVPKGRYEVTATAIGSSPFYVADIREGARSVFDDGLEVSNRPIDSLEVVLGFDGGAIEGTIASRKKSPVVVVLAPPTSRRGNTALFRSVSLDDPSEAIRISNIAPGAYKLFAFEVASREEIVPYLDPDFLSLHEARGVSINVERGATIGSTPLPLISR